MAVNKCYSSASHHEQKNKKTTSQIKFLTVKIKQVKLVFQHSLCKNVIIQTNKLFMFRDLLNFTMKCIGGQIKALKDSHREKTLSNETLALTKSMSKRLEQN